MCVCVSCCTYKQGETEWETERETERVTEADGRTDIQRDKDLRIPQFHFHALPFSFPCHQFHLCEYLYHTDVYLHIKMNNEYGVWHVRWDYDALDPCTWRTFTYSHRERERERCKQTDRQQSDKTLSKRPIFCDKTLSKRPIFISLSHTLPFSLRLKARLFRNAKIPLNRDFTF